MGRDLAQGDAGAFPFAEYLPQHCAVAVQDLGRLEGLALVDGLEPGNAGLDLARLVGVDQPAGRGRATDDHEQQQRY